SGRLVADSNPGIILSIPALRNRLQRADDFTNIQIYRDLDGEVWFLNFVPLENLGYLLAIAPRPKISLFVLLKSEIESPLIFAGITALVLAFAISLLMAKWIASPLQKIEQAAAGFMKGEYAQIPLQGPADVRQLAEVFNGMTERVRSSQRSQQDFIANVSHELKTPITSIQGFSQAIMDGTAQTLEEQQQQAVEIIHSEAGRMHRLVLDLLSLSRLETGMVVLQREYCDIGKLLEDVINKFGLQSRESQIVLNLQFTAMPVVFGDADQLLQVFTNLIDNALKYSPAGSEITITVSQDDDNLSVRVVDRGIGIPSEERSRIFERFYQLDKSRRGGSVRGVGLGLSIARQIILAHHGTIQVEDTPGGGSTFIVTLPRKPEAKSRL
ncbi:MAG: HAMP domain-containing histidine kinase, partial [Anaerolineaceae bacterium]|nr:HAMP domain-containing histidine kinase [Anaerolineaceae bacterium]